MYVDFPTDQGEKLIIRYDVRLCYLIACADDFQNNFLLPEKFLVLFVDQLFFESVGDFWDTLYGVESEERVEMSDDEEL